MPTKEYCLTDLGFYMNWPMCGHCATAWDVIYQRLRSSASPEHYVNLCPVGGCDPEIWDFLDDRTGWPVGWELDSRHIPIWSELPDPPLAEPQAYHRRELLVDSNPHAPWRKVWDRLHKENQKRNERRAKRTDDELDWDEPEPDEDDSDEDDDQADIPEDEWDWGDDD